MSPKDDKTATQQRRAAFGRRLRTLREQAGLTQAALAAAAGLDRSFYNEVETGRHSISVDRTYALADALGVRIDQLFTHTDPTDQHQPPNQR